MTIYQPARQNFAVRADDKRLVPRKRLSRELKDRFASIVEADLDRDGLWEDVARFYGCDVKDLPPIEERLVRAIVKRVAHALRR